MTEPLTPASLDLRDFPYMPLDVVRLRDSDLATVATGDEFRAAVLLWCAAWHQVPAASLPSDDKVLAKLAGFGRDMKGWRAARDGAIHGFIPCDDGRLYHPVIAEKALEAGEKREAYRKRTAAATAARQAQRDKERYVERGDVHDEQRDVDQVKGRLREGKEEREVCDTPSQVAVGSGAYPAEFDAFWLRYPENSSSKFEAFGVWERLSDVERQQAFDAIPAFMAWTRKQPEDYTMLSAKRYLENRRFEKFVDEAEKISKVMAAQSTRVYHKYGSDGYAAWDKYIRATTGRPAARDANGGWWFDAASPPQTQEQAA